MKISCQSCAAKYTIADEKVVGKIVKIRCKKCSATIVVNGNDSAALAAGGADTSAMPEFAATESAASDPWTVNVAEGDQRTLSISEVVQLFKAGVIAEDSYCWRDGMSDWLPLRDIDILHGACMARSTIEPDLEAGIARSDGGFNPGQTDEIPAASVAGGAAALFGDGAAPAAARRVGGGRAGGADLFGAVARAGGDDDVMTSIPMSGPRGAASPGLTGEEAGEPKLTGQRNESSVLFSLSALTEKAPEPSSSKVTEGSGLIDIRALAAPKSGAVDSDRRGKVDDIMNLGGGGAFSAALAAPVLAPPPMGVEATDHVVAGASPKSNKMVPISIIAAALILGLAFVFVMNKNGDRTAQNGPPMPSPTSAAPTETVAAPAQTTTPNPPPADTSGAVAPVAGGVAAAGTTQPAAAANKAGKTTASRGASGGGDQAPDPSPTPTPAAAPPPAAKPSLNDAMRQFAGGDNGSSASAGGGSTAPFDRGAAAAALGAVNVASCKKADGPTGSGHVSITFATNGSVQTAVVDSPPFEGTGVGGCVAGKFRSAHVPGFSGGAQRVGKSFTIN